MQINKPVLFVSGVQCNPEVEERYNKWYHEEHVPHLMGSELLKGVTRYQLAPTTARVTSPGEHSNYLTIYVFTDVPAVETFYAGPEKTHVLEDRRQKWGVIGTGETLKSEWAVYKPIKSWSR